jgi:hypothetical protein
MDLVPEAAFFVLKRIPASFAASFPLGWTAAYLKVGCTERSVPTGLLVFRLAILLESEAGAA